jgi:glycosyltransferase involved in cell wall biosynthesis
MAFHTPGGGEVQLLKYKEYLEKKGLHVDLMDMWNPNFKKYDVFHFFSSISGSNHLCNFVKRLNIPVVISSSLWITEETKNQYPCDQIKAHLDLANKIVTNSMAESKELSKVLDIGIDKFEHIYNGVDKDFSKNVDPRIFRKKYGIWDPFLLNVGNIEPRKNQFLLAEAARIINRKLILIGHIRDYNYANHLFASYPEVRYLGPLPHNNLLVAAYKACDVFCLPSMLETPGLAAIEAATVGTKLSVTEVGSAREYFGDYASYINPSSLDSIVESILGQMRSTHNSISNFEYNNFYWENVVEKLSGVYKTLLH